MYPILGRYGSFFLFSYTAVISIGIIAGIGLAFWRARRRNMADVWLDGVLVALLAGLIGGRAGFVWLEWGYFGERPSQIIQLQLGGLSYHGALLAGLVGLWGWHKWRKRPLRQAQGRSFLPTADLIAPSIALASAFGWAACWLEGCGYGRTAVAGSFLAASLPDHLGIFAWRYQTQLLGIGLSLLIFIWALIRQPHWRPGQTFGFTLFALSLGRVGVDLLRGDSALFVGNIRADILLDAALAIISLLLLKYTHFHD